MSKDPCVRADGSWDHACLLRELRASSEETFPGLNEYIDMFRAAESAKRSNAMSLDAEIAGLLS